jgi:hypothetical protein
MRLGGFGGVPLAKHRGLLGKPPGLVGLFSREFDRSYGTATRMKMQDTETTEETLRYTESFLVFSLCLSGPNGPDMPTLCNSVPIGHSM